MVNKVNRESRAFSLLELVIVVVIIGIIAAIAIPRMSRGSAGAADSALSANLAVLRNGIDLFMAEHTGKIPTVAQIADALTKYSNAAGTEFVGTKDNDHTYGPYVRAIPPLPVGDKKGSTGISDVDAAGIGWIYSPADGSIKANTTAETDDAGTLYSVY